jgi:hypothetical protein
MFAATMPWLADIVGFLVISALFGGIVVVLIFIDEMIFDILLNGWKITLAGIIGLTICIAFLCAVCSLCLSLAKQNEMHGSRARSGSVLDIGLLRASPTDKLRSIHLGLGEGVQSC